MLVETTKSLGREVLRGIARFVRTRGSWSTIVDERVLTEPVPRWLQEWKGDGIICRANDETIIDFAMLSKIPVVCLGEEILEGVPTVAADDELISQRAADHMFTCRLSKFAFAGVKDKVWSELRKEAFTRIIRDSGMECPCFELNVTAEPHRSWDRDQRMLGDWIETLPIPTGIFAAYDVLGLQTINACHAIGRLVPDEVAVMGVDNNEALCDLADPPMTSVSQDFEGIGFAAARLLDRVITGDAPMDSREVIGPLNVVVRQSTDMIVVPDEDVAMALRYIRENAYRRLSVDQIADYVNLTRRTLERRFAQFIQRSPKEEILRVQVNRVKELLVESDYSLEEIAALTGFNHVSHMCVLFKKRANVSPGQYRRKVQK